MLIEQAFGALPEILCGSSYPRHENEGGLVSAFTMAVLQELNGRNISNPLSCLQNERLYWPRKEAVGFGGRYLRADLVVRLESIGKGNTRIASYGWRYVNWLEAKFFRDGKLLTSAKAKKSSNSTTHTADLLADIIRLVTLVPEYPADPKKSGSFNGRYLLHIYDAAPEKYVAFSKNTKGDVPGGERQWLQDLYKEGNQSGGSSLRIDDLEHEVDAVKGRLGDARRLKLTLAVTNRVIKPVVVPAGDEMGKVYWCYLLRIDEAKVEFDSHAFTLGNDRMVTETSSGDFMAIRQAVAKSIKLPSKSREKQAADDVDSLVDEEVVLEASTTKQD